MKALSSHPLDDDIVDRIFLFLPDFETLQAAILGSKSMYSVFSAHPHSIVKAIAFNLVGPALLSAINVLRCQPPDDPWTFGHALPEPTEVGVITPEDTRKLSRNALVVNTFQDIFSSRHKDRSSDSSQLSPVEALRFTRAMYRIMLFADVFPGKCTIYIDDEDTEQEAEIRAARKDFFAMFPTQELYEIYTVDNFIESLGTWLVRKVKNMPWAHCQHANAVPPAVFLEAYQERDPQLIDNYFDDDTFHSANNLLVYYIEQPLEDVWKERKEPSSTATIVQQQCDINGGIDLWTESNWAVQNSVTLAFLPCILEYLPMPGCFYTHVRGVPVQDLLRDLFALKTPEYASWSPQDKLCEGCLKRFMTDHIHLWLRQRKHAAGETIPEDCWYGYNCRTQAHNAEHAKKRNHLCAEKKE
ncbi:hypothetical protein B0H13DRAFT_2064834 [Mycena leptocephala]|nr:hypothetical protein B0H13DRAFT_2064834 [Mycena leptocephala]